MVDLLSGMRINVKEAENAWLKKLLADAAQESEALEVAFGGKAPSPPARRQVVGRMLQETSARQLAPSAAAFAIGPGDEPAHRRAGIRANSHSGRRLLATNLTQHGADIYSVMPMMGHFHIDTTQVYFSSDPSV